MNQSIIYPSSSGSVVLVSPNLECGLSIQEIARKDVPAAAPFLIIENASLPADFLFYEAWEADFSSPHGYGVGSQAWFIEQYKVEIAAINTENASAETRALVATRIEQLNTKIVTQQTEIAK